jgi:glycosyltransferase involved in cell wall biosynthesis
MIITANSSPVFFESTYAGQEQQQFPIMLPAEPMQRFDGSVSLLTWALNEELLIDDFLNRAVKLLETNVKDWEIIFVNDGSTDGTREILEAWAKKDSRIRPIHNERNLNVGQSARRAIKAASKDYLFWQTLDWSYDISNIRIFLELLGSYDVVQGVRPTPIRLLSSIPVLRSLYRVKTRSDNFRKAVVSLTNYYLLRIMYGVPFQDFQNVSFYPTKLLQSVELSGDSAFINPECLLRTYETGARYIEVPIPFTPRIIGTAKGTRLSSILKAVRDVFSGWARWGWHFRLKMSRETEKRIYRVAEPFNLEQDVASLIVPLFKEYR